MRTLHAWFSGIVLPVIGASLLVVWFVSLANGDQPLEAPAAATASEYQARRVALAKSVVTGVLVVEAKGEGEYESVRDDFLYLTGVEAGGSRLVMNVRQGKAETVLFLPRKSPGFERWSGPRLSPGAEATRRTGIEDTRPLTGFKKHLADILPETKRVFLPATGPNSANVDRDLKKLVLKHTSEIALGPIDPHIHALRQVKSSVEVRFLKHAITITYEGLKQGMGRAGPDAWEFQVQGAIEGTFLEHGSPERGFPSIVGSGPNSCVLHYMKNRRQMKKNELLLMDVGATCRGYTADITRTIPVSGKFSARQRQVYEIVLKAQAAAAEAAGPGASLRDVHDAAQVVFQEAGLSKHSLHGTCHWVGLEVHDVGANDRRLVPGMVFTIEPGLYLVDEGLGIRIEDMFLVRSEGVECLSAQIPKSADDIERLVKKMRRKVR